MAKDKKKNNQKSKQQKPKSQTVKTVKVPKPEEIPGAPAEEKTVNHEVNLCDDCAYEFGECDGKPKFASELNPELTGESADHVVECEGFLNVAEMPNVDEIQAKAAGLAEPPGPEVKKKTPIDLAMEELDKIGKSILTSREDEICIEADRRFAVDNTFATDEELANTLVLIVREIIEEEGGAPAEEPAEQKFVPAPPPARPDPKRFNKEEDFGACPSCVRPLKRTALNRYRDAIRCTNPRCRAYRAVVKTVSTGVS